MSGSCERPRNLGEREGIWWPLFAPESRLVVRALLSCPGKPLSRANSGLSLITWGSTVRDWYGSDFGLSAFLAGLTVRCRGRSAISAVSIFCSPKIKSKTIQVTSSQHARTAAWRVRVNRQFKWGFGVWLLFVLLNAPYRCGPYCLQHLTTVHSLHHLQAAKNGTTSPRSIEPTAVKFKFTQIKIKLLTSGFTVELSYPIHLRWRQVSGLVPSLLLQFVQSWQTGDWDLVSGGHTQFRLQRKRSSNRWCLSRIVSCLARKIQALYRTFGGKPST